MRMRPVGPKDEAMNAASTSSSRSFRISLFVISIFVVSGVFFAWTHISLSKDELTMRISRRAAHLQNQMEYMLEKRRKEDELRKLVLQRSESSGTTQGSKNLLQSPSGNTEPCTQGSVDIEKISLVTSSDYKTAKDISLRFNTRYWLDNKDRWPRDPLPQKDKFLSFEPWNGGFNNIRMSLEMAAAMAWALNRTLVLPPKYKMYLRGTSAFQDYFDYEDLRRGFSAIPYEEFRKSIDLGKYDGKGEQGPSTSHMPDYYVGLEKMPSTAILKAGHPLIMEKIGSQLVLCFPNCPSKGDSDEAWFKGVQNRLHIIDTSKHPDTFNEPRILHFTPILLGHFYTLVWFRNPVLGAQVKRAVRDHIHFKEEMFVLAERIIKALGGDFTFSCLHVRRNEFQFKEVWTPAEDIVKNVGGLFSPGETIYIATDELSVPEKERSKHWNDPLAMSKVKTDHAWFKPMFDSWGGRDKVKFWSDYYSELGLEKDVPKIWIGSVESIVCSRARTFVGTQKSTFSGYIHRMRGYMHDVGQKELFEAQAKFPDHYYHALVGPSWSRFPHAAFGGGHPYWGREYKEAWEGVDNPLY